MTHPQAITRWLTTAELCAHFNIERTTLWRWRKAGLPEHSPNGRPLFDLEEVESWVRSRCSAPAPAREVAA